MTRTVIICGHGRRHNSRVLPDLYLQDSDVGGEDGVHRLLDVGVLFLHAVGVLNHHGVVG